MNNPKPETHAPLAINRTMLQSLLDAEYEPSVPFDQPIHRAAVAAILRQGGSGAEILLIQRAARDGDPWSGQMAFPGGRTDPVDSSPVATAIRETQEEVGLTLLDHHGVGTLAELDGGRATNRLVLVSAHGFWLDGETPALNPNYEVADVAWTPLSVLADRDRYIDYFYAPAEATFPGIELDGDGQVLWGLTLRFVGELFTRMGQPFLV